MICGWRSARRFGRGAPVGRNRCPRALPCTVRTATVSHAASSPAAPKRIRSAPVRAVSPIVPVTHVPTGKVKLYQVSPNGSPWVCWAVRTVSAAAMTSHTIANPRPGRRTAVACMYEGIIQGWRSA
jgi:hypothetical protein